MPNCLLEWLHHFTSHQQFIVILYLSSSVTFDGVTIFILAILMCGQWYLIVILISSSLMTNNVEHLFMCIVTSISLQ